MPEVGTDPRSSTSCTTLGDYASCLANNRIYLAMWLAEFCKQLGNWFTFVAAYSVVQQLTADPGLSVSLFLMSRRVPYLAWFTLSGFVADHCNKGAVLVVSCLLQGAVSLCLPLVRRGGQLPVLYGLILTQYSAQAFYDPARTATIPVVVPPYYICVASTLDTFGNSLTAVVGATVAGEAVAAFGTAPCFRVEAAAFAISALLLLKLALWSRRPRGAAAGGGSAAAAVDAAIDRVSYGVDADASGMQEPLLAAPLLDADGLTSQAHCSSCARTCEAAAAGAREGRAAGDDEGGHEERGGGGACSLCGGFAYLSRWCNLDVAALIWVKATGALVWGPADILNGRFASMESMQTFGGDSATLGFVLAAVGLGCIAGPLAANALVPGQARWWRLSIAASFAMLFAGYALMAVAQHIVVVLLATFVRTMGSNTLWVHSLAILQHRLDDRIRGRIFAIEFVLYTASEAGSTLAAGWAVDHLGLTSRQLSTACALLGLTFTVVWTLVAWLQWAHPDDDGIDASQAGAARDGVQQHA